MLNRFRINEDEKRCTLKRGGGVPLLSIDMARAEQFFGAEPTTDESPDRIFERSWALAILAAALERLREEVAAAGKARHFEILEPFLSREPEPMEYFKAGMELKIPQRSVAVAVHRLRQHYREMLRGELSLGATRRGDVEEELRALSQALTECA